VYFEIYFPSVDITLLEPADGVSSTSPYTVKIQTSGYADCRYHELSFVSYTTMTNEFTPNGDNTEHTISVEGSKNLYIRCKDEFDNTDNTKFIQTSHTSSAPSILAVADPTVIIEEISSNLQTTVAVAVASGPNVQCKYSASNPTGATDQEKYDTMTSFTSTSFASSHQETIVVLGDQQSFTYYIMCKGQNDLFSNIAPVSFSTDTTVPLAISSVNTPAYASSGTVTLNISTNKLSSCHFYNRTKVFTTTSNLKQHSYQLTSLPETSYTFYANCTKGSEMTAETTITFSIDSSAPTTPTINDDSSLTGVDKGYTWKTDELEASWSSSDNQSGIVEYQYRIENANGTVIVDWTSAGTSTSITVSGLDLGPGTYKFKVKAKNGAGQWSAVATSNGIIVDVTKKPAGDVTAPTGTVTTEIFSDRIEVTLSCADTGSGCNTKFYGLSALD
ncbi:MAG: triple tyrosine motif-containing protein, partial [Anaerolineales bacterium]|nr:triple tyrosine motif-containing protein [Anaerolineales bacterium]